MAISRETRDLIALWIMSLYDSRYVWGYPGRRNLDGTVDFEVPGRPGMTYVTLWRGQKLVVDMAVNLGANPNPNLLVQMERVRGVLTIVRPDPSAAAHLYGFLAGMAAIPPFYPAVGTGLTDPVEGRRFVPGLIAPSPAGGLAVQIFPFHHSGGYFPGDSQFEIDDPATGYAAVGVYVDTATNTASYIVGDTHADSAEIDDAALFDDLSAAPTSGIVRCGAVLVQAGQTDITTKDTFFDWRWHLDESVGRLLSEAAETLTLSSGAITAGSGSYILIAAESGTADDLDTLTVTGTPRLIILQADTGDTITVKHGVGNIELNGEADYELSGDKTLLLFWDGTNLSDVGIGSGGTGGGGLPAFGAGVTKTLSSGVATAGSDRHLILAAESGTSDDCIEVSGLSVGDEVIVRANTGDTITLKHDDAGATDKIILYNNADVALTGDQTMKLVKTASGKVVQYVDEQGAGGTFSQSYLGYNTIGGSQETWAGATVYYKQITLASAALLVSIDVYLDLPTTTNVQNINSWVASDNAGAPNLQIALGAYRNNPSFHLNTTARWLSLPISVWLPAGTYWLAVQRPVDSGSDLRIYYDGSGSDIRAVTAGAWSSDYSQQTPTATSNKYSIRASILS